MKSNVQSQKVWEWQIWDPSSQSLEAVDEVHLEKARGGLKWLSRLRNLLPVLTT